MQPLKAIVAGINIRSRISSNLVWQPDQSAHRRQRVGGVEAAWWPCPHLVSFLPRVG